MERAAELVVCGRGSRDSARAATAGQHLSEDRGTCADVPVMCHPLSARAGKPWPAKGSTVVRARGPMWRAVSTPRGHVASDHELGRHAERGRQAHA